MLRKRKHKSKDLLGEKRTHLAQKRTELAHERTVMSYVRTATTVILFGIAFFGLSQVEYDFFYYAGWVAVVIGAFFILAALVRSFKHSKDIRKIKDFFEDVVEYKFKKEIKFE